MSQDHDRITPIAISIRLAQLLVGATPLTLEQLADHIGLSTRTVRRYIYALQLAGVDVEVLRPDAVGNLVGDEDDDAEGAGPAAHGPGFYRLQRRAWLCALDLPPAAGETSMGGAR